jgi:hypothetical protein
MKKWIFLAVGLGVFFSSTQVAEGKGGGNSSVVKAEELITPVNYAPEFTLPKGSRRCTDAESKKIYDVFKSSLREYRFTGGACFKIPKKKYKTDILENYAVKSLFEDTKLYDRTNLITIDGQIIMGDKKKHNTMRGEPITGIIFYAEKIDDKYATIISMDADVSVINLDVENLKSRFKEIKW